METEATCCPVCGAPPRAPKYRFGSYGVVVCPCCTVEYLNPRPVPEAIAEIYRGEDYFHNPKGGYGYPDYAAQELAVAATSRRRLDRLWPFLDYGAKRDILEVGPAYGFFLDVAQARGLHASAVEISDAAVARLRARHDRVYSGTLTDHSFSGVFDAILLFDTIEHVSDLTAFIGAAHGALRPDGALAFTTPDTSSLLARLLGRRWHSYRVPEHLVYFNDRSLRALFAGRFELIHHEPDVQSVTLGKVVDHVHWKLPWLGMTLATTARRFRLAQLMVPLPNGMKLYVARRLP